MRPIGFSTGALAKGDVALGLALQRELPGIEAVELSALRDRELPALLEALPSLDVSAFAYVSVHAPSRLQTLEEESVFRLLEQLPEAWPIVVHPEILVTPSLWRRLGSRLCLENMDDRKTTGRTPDELRELFAVYPEAGFCLDVGHARQIDRSMAAAREMLAEFGERLRQLHVSEVSARGEHLALNAAAREAFAGIAAVIPAGCPAIIESVVAPEEMTAELAAVRAALQGER
ncbi:MAG TPA: hypothetical protein VGF69_11855 [Thermoanaerobaculia bacterium]|jgi:hypothetical protein